MNNKLILKGATAVLAGLFCLGVVAPSSVLAQGKPAAEMGAKKPMAKKMVKKTAKSNKAVMALQEALNKNGAKLKADGVSGKQTRAALRNYQKANGLKVTGTVNKATKAKLGL